MTYATLMVHLDIGRANAERLRVTAALAERFGANVIGIAACRPLEAAGAATRGRGDAGHDSYTDIEAEIGAAEVEFRAALRDCARTLEWRSTKMYELNLDYLARQSRSADLVICAPVPGDLLSASRVVDTGDLVLHLGRPVLVVPFGAKTGKLERILVASKDSREARRSVADALPLLKKASHVAVVEIADDDGLAAARANVADVVAWLARHGVEAEALAAPSGISESAALRAVADDQGADVVVAGGYGHSRMREHMLGGMTRDLLAGVDRCAFLSH